MSLYDGDRYFHRIPGLLIPRGTRGETTNAAINKFIDIIPDLVDKIEGNFANINLANRKGYFIGNMEILIALLQGVYARSLESEATRLLNNAKDEMRLPYAIKNMRPFITDILSLSVAMQKAQNLENEQRVESLSKIEVVSNIVKNIAEIANLINEGNDRTAKAMLIDLADYIPGEEAFAKLLTLLRGKHWDKAKTAVAALKEKYDGDVKKLAGVDLSKKILAVDDMPEILSFVNNALKSHYKIIAVPSGKMAIKVLEAQKPDLFLFDIEMPEMNGIELAKIARDEFNHKSTPLIYLTGKATRDYVQRAMQVGCNDFIVKPASHDVLLTKVGKYLVSEEV